MDNLLFEVGISLLVSRFSLFSLFFLIRVFVVRYCIVGSSTALIRVRSNG